MRTTKFNELTSIIAEKQKTIRKGSAKMIREENAGVLAFKSIEALDRAVFRSLNEGQENVYVQFTSLAAGIGKSVLIAKEEEDLTIQKLNTDRFRVGVWLLDRLADYGVIKLNNSRKGTQEHTVSILDWEKFNSLLLAVPINIEESPVDTRPLLTRPEEFKSFKHKLGPEIARKASRRARRLLKRADTPQVYAAINKQMQTGYKINTNLLSLFNEMDLNDVSNLEAKNLNDIQRESVNYSATSTLRLANAIGEEEFWTMMYYDFRGRLYQSTSYLNYGASKLSKSLFLLSDEKVLGDSGEKWIKVHIANSWKWDKETIVNREELVTEHLDEFLPWLDDIAGNMDSISQADDPYAFLAGLLELKRYLDSEDKESFTSGLPIALDMTCSGLQILSMLSRDHLSASLCNLLPETARGDYYLYIADNLDSFKIDPYWHRFSAMRRKIVKRSAMTYFYSCGARTMGEHIWNDFKSAKGFESLTKADCYKLGQEIYDTCRRLMPGATKLMDRFIALGLAAYKEGEHFGFLSPTGFPVDQSYSKNETKQIKSKFQGDRLDCRVITKKNAKIWYSKVKSATSPNVVHAFDAALLSFIVTEGGYDKAIVHDSFAAVPGDAERLFHDTRSVAVNLFSDDQLLKCLGVDDVEYGELDLNGIRDNQFFCG